MAADQEEELQEMRCRCCGVFMGYRRRIGRFVFWCCEDCSETPMSKWEESQIRDETIVAMFLDGQGIMEISRNLNNWPYQYVQQTLARRGLQEWDANERVRAKTVAEALAEDEEEEEETTVPARRRVLVRQAS
jgi:hypothetical protein